METNIKTGLTDIQIMKSIKKYGLNVFFSDKKKNIFRIIFLSLKDPMNIFLLIAALISLIVNLFFFAMNEYYNFLEFFGIFFAVIISIFLKIFIEKKLKFFVILNS